MNIKRCDRCNAEIKKGNFLQIGIEEMGNLLLKAVGVLTGKPNFEIYRDDHPADLCPACKKSFDAWMKAGGGSHQKDEETMPKESKFVLAKIEDHPESIKFGDF